MHGLLRSFKIFKTLYFFGLFELAAQKDRESGGGFRRMVAALRSRRSYAQPLALRLRLALESLGPIFVKFGQVLSTRPDILPPEYVLELSRLQDKVPPFDPALAQAQIETALKRPLHELFARFEAEPVASASVAQVHEAWLFDDNGGVGAHVAVKVLRPNIRPIIEQDLALLRRAAWWVEKLFPDGRRLKPREVVAEFEQYLHDELDLMNEAGNCSLIGRQFEGSRILQVPQVYYDYCARNVMVMEWMTGVPIADTGTLKSRGIDLKALARHGVEIFFTQVFKNGFFHADMHPGNILVGDDGRYIALDFGIVGSLNEYDKRYLAINFLAFFNRDYHRVATAHIESGWVPADTRPEALEAAVRTVCEPIFNKPIAQISFGLVLMRLFETSRRFNVEIQPQLVLLQKTLLNVEGLGRQLDPDLDLWATAKPFLMRWMDEQFGLRGLVHNLKNEAPEWARVLPGLPRRLNTLLESNPHNAAETVVREMIRTQRRQNLWLAAIAVLMLVWIVLYWR